MPFGEFPEIRRRNFTRPPGKELGEIIWEGEGKTWKAIGRTVHHVQVDQIRFAAAQHGPCGRRDSST